MSKIEDLIEALDEQTQATEELLEALENYKEWLEKQNVSLQTDD